MASFSPMSALSKVLLPALGLPNMLTKPAFMPFPDPERERCLAKEGGSQSMPAVRQLFRKIWIRHSKRTVKIKNPPTMWRI
jgi:hypothetical protein